MLTLQQQIEVLKQRGLLIENESASKDVLDTISYFRLAGYWRLMQDELHRSEDEYILEHSRKYDHPSMPPVWKTMEVASMGTLSKLYGNMSDNAAKKAVSRSFMIPKFEYMRNWLRCITVVRNICAHHARLWERRASMTIMLHKWIPHNPFLHAEKLPCSN